MAEDTQPAQSGNSGDAGQTIQQVQQGIIQQTQDPEILRKGYGPLVEPAPDAFPVHYRSPYVPGPGANGAAAPEPAAAPAVDPGQSSAGATSTTSTTQQQGS